MNKFIITPERDNTLYAMRKRYDKANELSIVTANRIMFDALRDNYMLVIEMTTLLEEFEKNRAELLFVKEQLKVFNEQK
jgi:hypothetical protein